MSRKIPPGPVISRLTSAKDQSQARALGLTSATGLVTGTVVGAGVFTMPAVLAAAGTVSLVVVAVIAVGAMVLAILFGQLARRIHRGSADASGQELRYPVAHRLRKTVPGGTPSTLRAHRAPCWRDPRGGRDSREHDAGP